jgi:2-dehydro-3-deoxy-D-arabinonate dehydratase
MALWKVGFGDEERLAVGSVEAGPQELLPAELTIDRILAGQVGTLPEVMSRGTGQPVPDEAVPLAPVGTQEIWAAGVTYLRSREARKEEARDPDHYDRVYVADRPELFFKASAVRTRGPRDEIGVRVDSTWDVPEAELGLVIDSGGDVVGYVVGNDVSSRSIEGENPLYLPQAKCYTGSCAIGPCIVSVEEVPEIGDAFVRLQIRRDGEVVFQDEVALSEMYRDPRDLADWLFRALEFPVGVVLLTGTALIPPAEFTLKPGDETSVTIDGLGQLGNPVVLVGRTPANAT